ncbi:glycosyltransferase family 4 protein [Candidatus Woesearchaeota archaeon]|nr:glycosyltransferase family 4 protein [Candidatus Woesearchaeota archaeon]
MKRKFMIEESSKIITISEYNQKYLKKILGIKKVPIVHDAINTELFKPSIKKSSNKIITIGRFVEQKGMDFLIEACNILNKNKVSYNCVIIGDGPLKKQYVEKIKKYEIPNIVFKGSLNSKEVKSELASSSVFVLPCIIASDGDRDILPNVLKEAMAMEIPIVTSNICGIKELVENGVSGLLVPTKNSEAVANAIRKILENPDFGRKLGFAGRLKIKKNYDIEKESKKLQTIFQEGCL